MATVKTLTFVLKKTSLSSQWNKSKGIRNRSPEHQKGYRAAQNSLSSKANEPELPMSRIRHCELASMSLPANSFGRVNITS
jgi:hypothetical protein